MKLLDRVKKAFYDMKYAKLDKQLAPMERVWDDVFEQFYYKMRSCENPHIVYLTFPGTPDERSIIYDGVYEGWYRP